MKMFCLAVVLLLSNPVFASWEKIISCDGDMLVVDRQQNALGSFDYQTVFRNQLVQSMIEQKVISKEDLNSSGELIKPTNAVLGGLINQGMAFYLTNFYSKTGNYSLIFNDRWGQTGNYVFHSCWFKYSQVIDSHPF